MAIVPQKEQQIQFRSDSQMLSTSDEETMMKQIQDTHAPADGREVELKPLLHIIEAIFHRAATGIPGIVRETQAHFDALDDKALSSDFDTIYKISREISFKCYGAAGSDAHATTVTVFNILTSYQWDAKVVLALAAFAVNYGKFWLVAQLYPTNSLAKVVALLKQLPEISNFDALSNLIKAMLAVTKCILEFRELPSNDITPDTPELQTATAHIPIAVYWTIRSIVACTSHIMGLIVKGHEHTASTVEAWELSSLAQKVTNIHTDLYNQYIEYKHFLLPKRPLETPAIDNMKIPMASSYLKDDQLPLVYGSSNKRKARQLRSDSQLFSTPDYEVRMKQIQDTHAPDGREVELKPLLHIIEVIFHRAATGIPSIVRETKWHFDALDDKDLPSCFDTIHKIFREISCKCYGAGGDAHATIVAVFNILTSYSWDAKVVLALAAFAVSYGKFCLVAQLYPTNSLAKVVTLLKKLPEISNFDALSNLIKAMLAVTKCILEFRELPSEYITPDTPELQTATAHIQTAIYWTIRSIVECASQILGLIVKGHERTASTTETWELSSLAQKVTNIHTDLNNQLVGCYQYIDYKVLLMLDRPFETPCIDNMKILRALFYANDDQLPLVDGATKLRVSIDLLRRKNVLLFISDLKLSHDELFILVQTYQETRQHPTRAESQFEVVWLPFVDWWTPLDKTKQKQFVELQKSMPWYSVYHPLLLGPAVIRYIKDYWCFKKKPLLVVLDPQGIVVNPNAIHMMRIWGSNVAFPFTSSREEALWKEESWKIELLAGTIDPLIFTWINEGKYICLFGGKDMEWIRKFSSTAREVAEAAQIPLEMLYVGKSNPKEKVHRNMVTIVAEKLGDTLPDLTFVWFFWVRLESMWYSKVQQNKSVENDPIMKEVMTMLNFDASEQGWALISEGSADMAKAKGDTILKSLEAYDAWKTRVEAIGFIAALNEHLREQDLTRRRSPKCAVCAECGRPKEKFIMYR